MTKTISDLEPRSVWRNFHLLTQVPRPSGHLQRIQQFLLDWAKEKGVEAYKDNAENIVMRKPATPGLERLRTAVLQAHMDMVPQKSASSAHNFETDPIQAYVDGEWVKTRDTTLGSDDGIGVAAIMAIMESDSIAHGPLEALITADEETGMYGVNDLSGDTLTGDILLNIDNETLGEFVIGSAGGVNISACLGYKRQAPNPGYVAMRVTIGNLRGGHSGLEINEGRANANKLMARLMREVLRNFDMQISSWHGGNMRNAIPRSAEVTLALPAENVDRLCEMAAHCRQVFNGEYDGIEDGISVEVVPADMPQGVVPRPIRDNLVNSLCACHDGVFRNIPSIPSVVETSSNLGIVDVGEERIDILILARSSNETMLKYLETMQEACFAMAGMKVSFDGFYGPWQPNFQSPVAGMMVETYNSMYPDAPARLQVCHAGLECSVIGQTYPKMDMVSFGPTLRSPHTTDERCNIPSVARFWDFLVRLLSALPEK